jgi:hypothetical protein
MKSFLPLREMQLMTALVASIPLLVNFRNCGTPVMQHFSDLGALELYVL